MKEFIKNWIDKNDIPRVNTEGDLLINKEGLINLLTEYKQCNIGAVSSSTYFKVKFIYDRVREGRSVWVDDIRIFDAVNSEELHIKIDEYIKLKSNDSVSKRYSMQMVDVEKI